MAHFAVITFGLVALLGDWRDPLQGLHVAFALSVLLALIFIGLAGRAGRQTFRVSPQPDALIVHLLRRMRRAWALRELLEFIRRAHLSCGAPPCLEPNHSFPQGEGSMRDIACRALAFSISLLGG